MTPQMMLAHVQRQHSEWDPAGAPALHLPGAIAAGESQSLAPYCASRIIPCVLHKKLHRHHRHGRMGGWMDE